MIVNSSFGRKWVVIGVAMVIVGLGAGFAFAPRIIHLSQHVPKARPPASAAARADTTAPEFGGRAKAREIDARFREGVYMLHAKRFEYAVTAFHRVLALDPRLPEAHVNMGYTLLGLKQYEEARAFFAGAVDLRPGQWNAYYGLAIANEELGALPEAIGAMRTFIHLAPPESPFMSKARAALWEWETPPDSGEPYRSIGGRDDAESR